MHYARRTEHNTTEDEEAHLHYQSRRRHCTLFFGTPYSSSSSSLPISTGAPPFLLPIYTRPQISHSFWTPLLHYPSTRGHHKYTPLHIPLFPLPNTTGPHIHTLFLDTPHSNTHLHGGPKIHPFGHPPFIQIPISTGATKIPSFGHPLSTLPIFTEAHLHHSYTHTHIHPSCTTSYGRSNTFDYLSSFV